MEKEENKKSKSLKKAMGILEVAIVVVVFILMIAKFFGITVKNVGKTDDWVFEKVENTEESYVGSYSGGTGTTFDSIDVTTSSIDTSSSTNIGYSTGGAMDANNFRDNIEEGYLPISTDITYTGLFYDYTFDTGSSGEESDELFYPSYSCAVSDDPISNEEEYYMTVGLNSNIKEDDFERKKLNLVVLLDISGSMDGDFDSYYYDDVDDVEDMDKSKMQIANESVNILIDQLNDDDRFGMVLFESSAHLAKPLNLVSETNIDAIKEHILEIKATGGTNFEEGYLEATKLFDEYLDVDTDEYENRIIVITDAMPNIGTTSKQGLLDYVEENADNGIYTTFIGVGVDFNTELTEKISDVRGANYYSVNSASEFKERMGEQFEYMVTPLVFDLELDLISDEYEIEAVYGSDTANALTGNIMSVNTLFPSKTTDGEVKGGVILLKLNKLTEGEEGNLQLNVSYTDRSGDKYENNQTITFNDKEENYYDNTGIRKAIVLTRYASTLKDWILYERSSIDDYMLTRDTGIIYYDYTTDDIYKILGENERTSTKLTISTEYKEIFETIKDYIEDENSYIKDDTLEQEIDLLDYLIKYDS